MIKFEKVSLKQFAEDVRKVLMPHATDEQIKEFYDSIELPKRGSKGSAGYDFYCPIPFELKEEEWGDVSITIPTGIRAIMPEDVFLQIVPRSGIGFKTGVYLANTVGIIDSDYAESSNEGHILVKLCSNFKSLVIDKGDRFVQGIFQKYCVVTDDDAEEKRTGGFGSTGK